MSSKVTVPFKFRLKPIQSIAKSIDKRPKIKCSINPIVPESLQSQEGYVELMLKLDARGNVVSAATKESSDSALEEPTLSAARQWKFRPAIQKGEAVSASVVVPVHFED